MIEHLPALQFAREIAAEALGRDCGDLVPAESMSHRVFVGLEAVVKIIDADGHARLDRETALLPHLPDTLAATLLTSGCRTWQGHDVRFACYRRLPGITPAMGLPAVDAVTARTLTEQAVDRLNTLHAWVPDAAAARILREPLNHGGFTDKATLVAAVDLLGTSAHSELVPPQVLAGLTSIAAQAPAQAVRDVPVHGDCHWGNWLIEGVTVTALLDYEWARFGDPLDDWFFLARFSGRHREVALDVICRSTGLGSPELRAACEVREAAYLVSDLPLCAERTGGAGPSN